MDKSNLNLIWSYQIASILSSVGIKYACICPGSRNSALIIGFTDNLNFITSSHIDERSAGYFALGISKKNNIPTVVITTSGTAVANLFPSIIESNLSKTPLIILTADRPSHLIDKGGNQTINQKDIYGKHVRNFNDVGSPSENFSLLQKKIESSYQHSIGINGMPPGPVHINIPFDEPLVPKLIYNYENTIKANLKIDTYKSDLNLKKINFDKSLIVCGEIPSYESLDSILELSEHIDAPILADPTSNLRYYKKHRNIISNYNFILDKIKITPNAIIRFGRKPTSKVLTSFIKDHNNVVLVDKYPTYNDDADNYIKSNYNDFLIFVRSSYANISSNISFNKLFEYQNKISSFIEQLNADEYNCEGMLINRILNELKPNTNVFIGNSMAIREADDFTVNIGKNINIYCNRGASGIDGLVSTALGISYSSTNKSILNVAILGDLSFFHDMNGLFFCKGHELNTKFIILNNNGGGIFSSLDIEKLKYPKFKEYWTTPLNLDLKKIANVYNIKYSIARNPSEAQMIINKNTGVEIIDYKIDIKNSKKIKKKIKDLLGNLV